MKRNVFVLLVGLAVAASAAFTTVKWKSTEINLGKIQVNEPVELRYEFVNNGKSVIQILEAKGSCGCTDVSYSKESIEPGASASITATFKTAKVGTFKKSIRVKTTASQEYTNLYFFGEGVSK